MIGLHKLRQRLRQGLKQLGFRHIRGHHCAQVCQHFGLLRAQIHGCVFGMKARVEVKYH